MGAITSAPTLVATSPKVALPWNGVWIKYTPTLIQQNVQYATGTSPANAMNNAAVDICVLLSS